MISYLPCGGGQGYSAQRQMKHNCTRWLTKYPYPVASWGSIKPYLPWRGHPQGVPEFSARAKPEFTIRNKVYLKSVINDLHVYRYVVERSLVNIVKIINWLLESAYRIQIVHKF